MAPRQSFGRRRGRRAYRRLGRYIALLLAIAALAGGWPLLWNHASQVVEETVAGWRAREARLGRIHSCGAQTIGGFPFRVELRCERAVTLLHDNQPPLELKTADILVAAQIYQPTMLISEFTGPLTVGEPGRSPDFTANWQFAQSSVRGTPAAPERVSIVFDNPTLDRVSGGAANLFKARRIELHGRMAEGSAAERPAIEIVLRLTAAAAPTLSPLSAQPVDADITAVLRGLKDFSPKPWAVRFREMQAAGGRIDIVAARLQQGETIAVGSGTLTLNARGRLDGQLNLTVAGLEALVNAVGAATRQQSGFGFTLGLGLLGGSAQIDGRPAISLPLRVSDGAIFLGPIALGQVAPLF